MKELSIEEKSLRYDKVSKEVKDFFEGKQKMYSDVNQTLEYLFPELKESEDEKIRKELIRIVDIWTNSAPIVNGIPREKLLAYLEKQGEQKPAWSEEDESLRRRCIGAIDMANLSDYTKDNLLNWLKSLKDRYTWKPSDEQIKSIKEAACYSSVFSEKTINNLISLSEQLKKLKY